MTEQKTNILVIQADQLNPAMLGAYNNPLAKTPHIDSLAENGVVFDSAYSNFPLCAPSRFSMMSGQLASTIGAYDNGAEFPSSIPTFAHYLRGMNYQTSLVGKMHFVGADQLHGFEQRLTTDIYPADFNWTGDWTEVQPDHANDKITFTGSGICIRNVQMEYDEEVCHRAGRKIYDLASGRDDRPFLLFASFSHPHDPYQCLQQHWDRYRHDDIDMPKVASIASGDNDPYSERLRRQYGLLDYQPSESQIRIARHAYFGSVSYLDDLVGRLLSVLKNTGLADNTVIIFTTDHSDMLGERGLWYKKSFFEGSCKIPLIMSGPMLSQTRSAADVSLVDLLPTLMEIGGDADGENLVEEIEGHSLWGLATEGNSDWTKPVYSENLAEGAQAPILMVKQGRMKYICSGVDPEQLFDLEKDPHELNNLIGNTAYHSTHETLSALARAKWDVTSLTEKIKLSQKRRLYLRQVLRLGETADWDYTAPDQVVEHCLRGDKIYNHWAYDDVFGFEIPKLDD